MLMMKHLKTDADRISNLPKEIIHDIMSRLTMLDIARTSCLSRTWKSFGVSLPYMNINCQEFGRHGALPRGWFKDFMERKVRSMSIMKEHLVVFKFKLCLNHALMEEAIDEIERCIKLIFKTYAIKDFEFQITDYGNLPCTFFHHICNAETLNVLRLSGLTLAQPYGDMKLSSLMILSLEKVKVDQKHGIDWVFTSFPMVREIRLVHIGFLKNLKVSGLRHLKRLEIDSFHDLMSVEIQAPGLQKLVLSEIQRARRDKFILNLKIDSQTCETLRELTLCNSTIQSFTFDRVFCGCTKVESLVLDGCKNFFKIKIASQNLRKLVVTRCFDLRVTEINAPNLTSFTLCNYLKLDEWEEYSLSPFLQCKKISHQQECLLDFSYMLMTKSIWLSLWFDKFKDIQGQKMVIYPKSGKKHGVVVIEDWSSMAELQLMSEICEAAAKTTITTMNFLDLADYLLETYSGHNDLEKVLTLTSIDESNLYEALTKKVANVSCNSSVAIAKTEVAAFLSGRCPMPCFSDVNVSSDTDIDSFSSQATEKTGISNPTDLGTSFFWCRHLTIQRYMRKVSVHESGLNFKSESVLNPFLLELL